MNKERFHKVLHALTIAFAIVAFWRGTWGLMDLYLFPNNAVLSFIISIGIGVAILLSTKNLIRALI